MIENIISLLKDDTKISNLSLYLIAILLVILILKPLFKSTKVKPVIFDILFWSITILMLISVIGNVMITENYNRLWNMIFVVAIVFFQRIAPKLVKWYDDKVDKLSDKI